MAQFKAVVWALIFLTKLRFPPGVFIAIVLKIFTLISTSISINQLLDFQLFEILVSSPEKFLCLCNYFLRFQEILAFDFFLKVILT